MVQIIAGKKGKGKTKHLLDMANAAIKGANGTVVYLDKSAQHMYVWYYLSGSRFGDYVPG